MKQIFLSVLLLAVTLSGFSTTWTITNSGFTFSPSTLTIKEGDSVKVTLQSSHNCIEVSLATWNANGNTALPGFSLPFGGGLLLPAQLTTGNHYYVCGPHAAFGMKGTIIVLGTNGIAEKQTHNGISVYPNPSNGIFQLQIKGITPAEHFKVEIFNSVGSKCFSQSDLQSESPNRIDISTLPKGVYYLNLFGGKETFIEKLIVY